MISGEKRPFSLYEHIFSIKNQKFVIEFIKQFNIFEKCPLEDYSPDLLKVCCLHRLNELLEFTIQFIEKHYKVKATFAAAEDALGPRITNTGAFFFPVEIAKDFNFY